VRHNNGNNRETSQKGFEWSESETEKPR
jgi:hypothetical protein